MEGAVAACLGNAAVGFLAQTVFGFNLANEGEAGPEEHNAEALGKAGVELKVTSCFQGFSFFFRGLHHFERFIVFLFPLFGNEIIQPVTLLGNILKCK